MTTPLPSPPQTSDGSALFASKADAFIAALVVYQAELDALAATLSPIGRNLLINNMFDFNQRAAATNADDTYAHDRWNILTQTGTVAVSNLGPAIENGFNNAMRITQSQASAQRFGFSQIIESKNCLFARGNSGTLQGRVRCSAATTIRYAILGWTGTADAVTSDVVNNWASATYTAGNFFLASNVSVLGTGSKALSANTWTSLTALTASLGTSFNNIIILVWTDTTQAQNVTLDCDWMQFEAGGTATAAERRSYSQEYELCRRHYRRFTAASQAYLANGHINNSTTAQYAIPLNPPMMGVPTVGSSGTVQNWCNASSTNVSSLAVGSASASEATAVYVTAAMASSTYSGGQACMLLLNSAGAYVEFISEL